MAVDCPGLRRSIGDHQAGDPLRNGGSRAHSPGGSSDRPRRSDGDRPGVRFGAQAGAARKRDGDRLLLPAGSGARVTAAAQGVGAAHRARVATAGRDRDHRAVGSDLPDERNAGAGGRQGYRGALFAAGVCDVVGAGVPGATAGGVDRRRGGVGADWEPADVEENPSQAAFGAMPA